MSIAAIATGMAESGMIPDSAIRFGIRRLVEARRKQTEGFDDAGTSRFVAMMDDSPIALVPDLANQQHYEVPAEFFDKVLGRHGKYSCAHWSDGAANLDEAEASALDISCQRAKIADGMSILDLGCGWGSLSLWIAEHYPNTRVTAVSNSASQREFIVERARQRGLANVDIVTADMNDFDIEQKFDRVVSVEMFEHLRNYRQMFARVAGWLKKDGFFFMHIFTHRSAAYEFLDNGPADWMSRHFFSGGIMPSEELPLHFQEDLVLDNRWTWSGIEYQKTAEAWLQNMREREAEIRPILAGVYGDEQQQKWWGRWQIFFLAVSEMFGSHSGNEWRVSHFRMRPNATGS